MKALVTGASGFIGSTLIEQLNAQGVEVFALMRKSSSVANLGSARYQRVDGDLSDLESLKRAVQGMDYIFHLAGVTAAPDRATYFRHNAEGSGRLAQAVAEAKIPLKRFVHVSSLAAAGPAKSPAPRVESELDEPVSAYGESKLGGEFEVLKYKDAFPISIVRPPIVYGPRDKGVYTIIQTVAKNLMPILQGSGSDKQKYYSVVHAADLCQGIIAASRAGAEVASGEVFYVTSGETHTYPEFLGAMAKSLGKKPLRLPVPKSVITFAAYAAAFAGKITGKSYPLNLDKLNEILPDYWICSNEKACRVLGYKPQYDLARGMDDTVSWYKKNGWL